MNVTAKIAQLPHEMAADGARNLDAAVEHCPGWAVRDPRPIERDVALVGLAEFVEVMSTDLRADAPPPPPVELATTDSPWTATLFTEAPGARLHLDGTASDLLLTLWGRRPVTDTAVAAALAAVDLS
jgi:MDMPI C-terminal domain